MEILIRDILCILCVVLMVQYVFLLLRNHAFLKDGICFPFLWKSLKTAAAELKIVQDMVGKDQVWHMVAFYEMQDTFNLDYSYSIFW